MLLSPSTTVRANEYSQCGCRLSSGFGSYEIGTLLTQVQLSAVITAEFAPTKHVGPSLPESGSASSKYKLTAIHSEQE